MISALVLCALQQAAAPRVTFAAEVGAARAKATGFLLANQNPDGSWGGARNGTYNDLWENPETHEAWTVATTGLVCMALLAEDAAADARISPVLERALARLVVGSALKRCSEWDMDDFWGYSYGLQALARVLGDARFSAAKLPSAKRAELERAARAYQDSLVHMRSGGWSYYAYSYAGWAPEWTTSFSTATAVLALLDARAAGLAVDDAVLRPALRAIELCRLPTGAYTYSLELFPTPGRLEGIDQVKSSLGRSQACNVALRRGGRALADAELTKGLDLFFQHHRFLQLGKGRPIPHEAYYAVASYFYWYGHWHAALAIDELPPEKRAPYAAKLLRIVLDNQERDGSMWDHVMHDYPRFYGTAYGLMAIQRMAPAIAR